MGRNNMETSKEQRKEQRCDEILSKMKDAGYDVVDTCFYWDEYEIEEFLANYETLWTKQA